MNMGRSKCTSQITCSIMEITGGRWQESHRIGGLAKILPVFLRNACQEESRVKLETLFPGVLIVLAFSQVKETSLIENI